MSHHPTHETGNHGHPGCRPAGFRHSGTRTPPWPAHLLIYDYDNSAKLGKGGDRPYVETRFGMIVDGKGTKGRYVRLYSNGNTSNEMNHYIEVEVFGIFG